MFFVGALGYSTLEMFFRGYTHWTMVVTGGFCVCMLLSIEQQFPDLKLWQKSLIGAGWVTMIEFAVGCIVNLWLGWNVWDYTNLNIQLFGQISLLFSFLWFLLCMPMFWMFQKLFQWPLCQIHPSAPIQLFSALLGDVCTLNHIVKGLNVRRCINAAVHFESFRVQGNPHLIKYEGIARDYTDQRVGSVINNL